MRFDVSRRVSPRVLFAILPIFVEGRSLAEICAEWHDAVIDEGIYELDEIKHLTHVIAHTLFKNADLYALLFKTLPQTDPVVESIDIEVTRSSTWRLRMMEKY